MQEYRRQGMGGIAVTTSPSHSSSTRCTVDCVRSQYSLRRSCACRYVQSEHNDLWCVCAHCRTLGGVEASRALEGSAASPRLVHSAAESQGRAFSLPNFFSAMSPNTFPFWRNSYSPVCMCWVSNTGGGRQRRGALHDAKFEAEPSSDAVCCLLATPCRRGEDVDLFAGPQLLMHHCLSHFSTLM